MKKNFFRENYSKCWKFFCECKWYFVFTFGVFAFLFLVGFVFPIFFREEIFRFLANLVGELEGKGALGLIWFIFQNNLRASFFAMVLGIGFGVFPLVISVVNGYLIGFVAREAVAAEGLFVFWKLVPHGIFELPAVIFSIGIGMKIGMSFFDKDSKKKLRYNFREGLRFFVFAVLPLLAIAAVIEGSLIYFFG